jgi:hypothetical protein
MAKASLLALQSLDRHQVEADSRKILRKARERRGDSLAAKRSGRSDDLDTEQINAAA